MKPLTSTNQNNTHHFSPSIRLHMQETRRVKLDILFKNQKQERLFLHSISLSETRKISSDLLFAYQKQGSALTFYLERIWPYQKDIEQTRSKRTFICISFVQLVSKSYLIGRVIKCIATLQCLLSHTHTHKHAYTCVHKLTHTCTCAHVQTRFLAYTISFTLKQKKKAY